MKTAEANALIVNALISCMDMVGGTQTLRMTTRRGDNMYLAQLCEEGATGAHAVGVGTTPQEALMNLALEIQQQS